MPRTLILLTFTALMLLPQAVKAAAAITAAERCEIGKLDAVARTLARKLQCHAGAARRGAVPKPDCLSSAGARLARAFDRVDGGECAVEGNAANVLATLDQFVGNVAAALRPPDTASACAAAKLRVSRRLATRTLVCTKRALRQGEPIDPRCLTRTSHVFAAVFAKAEDRGGCLTQGDAAAVEAAIADVVADVVALITSGTLGDPAPSQLGAAIVGGTIHLTWDNPDATTGNTHVRLVRRLNAPPTDAGDPAATLVFFGSAATADDDLTKLLPDTSAAPRTYHYAVFGCTAAGTCETTGSRTSLAPTVTQALEGGGYVIHWRHASATVCADRTDLGPAATTTVPDWWKSCDDQCPPAGMATARQLNATGVMEATAIGDAFRARGLPVGRVISSEFCRNVQTAVLNAFGPPIEESPLITFFVYDEVNRCTNSFALLAELPAAGTNTALIGHAGFSCPVLGSLAWGQAAIYKPDGLGATELITLVQWNEWTALP